jgi:hypothetical protein
MKHLSSTGTTAPNPLRKVAAFLVTTGVIALALTFSLLLLVVIAIGGALALVYVGWKTRGLRKNLRNRPQDNMPQHNMFEAGAMKGDVIEGEAIRVADPQPRRKGQSTLFN